MTVDGKGRLKNFQECQKICGCVNVEHEFWLVGQEVMVMVASVSPENL